MDAIVLVGGEGTRLRPLTYDVPKQMLPVVDRPMIEHVVAWLAEYGVDRVVLSLGYRPDAFVAGFPSGEISGARLVYAIEPELLDTAGAIGFAARSASIDGTFLVLNGDVLSDFDIGSLVAFHHRVGAEATIELTPVENPSAFGVVPTDPSGRVTAFIEKPPPESAPTNLINAGCYVLEPSVLERIPAGRRVSVERETFPALVASSSLFALASDSYWLDTGTPEKFLQASLDVLNGRRTPRSRPSAPEVAPHVFVDPSAVAAGEIGECCYLGPRSLVSEGAECYASVLGEEAVVGPGARVSGSILMAGARIETGAVVESSIIGPGATIGASSKVMGYTVVGSGVAVASSTTLEGARCPGP